MESHILAAVLLFFLPVVHVQADYFINCLNNEVVNIYPSIENNTGIITTNQAGSDKYENNQKCAWLISAPMNMRIKLTVLTIDVEWAPEDSSCSGYDYLEVRNGSSYTDQLAVWCNDRSPKTVISYDSRFYLTFTSNDYYGSGYNGITVRYEIFSKESCPPGWIGYGYSCFDVSLSQNRERSWHDAAEICNQNQANLVSFRKEEWEYVKDVIYDRRPSYGFYSDNDCFWIGLKYLKNEKTYRWMNYSLEDYSFGDLEDDRTDLCVCVDPTEGKFYNKRYCSSAIRFMCSMVKGRMTELFREPVDEAKKEEAWQWWYSIPIIAGVVVICVVFDRSKRHKRAQQRAQQQAANQNRRPAPKPTPRPTPQPAARVSDETRSNCEPSQTRRASSLSSQSSISSDEDSTAANGPQNQAKHRITRSMPDLNNRVPSTTNQNSTIVPSVSRHVQIQSGITAATRLPPIQTSVSTNSNPHQPLNPSTLPPIGNVDFGHGMASYSTNIPPPVILYDSQGVAHPETGPPSDNMIPSEAPPSYEELYGPGANPITK